MIFYLDKNLEQFFSPIEPLFKQMMALRGVCFRQQKSRLTQQISINNKTYFVKQHYAMGLKETLKNLFQLRLPVISAMNEWLAIKKLQSLGIATAKVVGYGQCGIIPFYRQSFILMEELNSMISLEDFCKEWKNKRPLFASKQKLIQEVARIARTLHENGMNHRDFYLCHFLLDTKKLNSPHPLFLIDLHRAQIRSQTPQRWKIKDLAGLYFSSKDLGLSKFDYFRFMKAYIGKTTCHPALVAGFWQKVKRRGERLYLKHCKP